MSRLAVFVLVLGTALLACCAPPPSPAAPPTSRAPAALSPRDLQLFDDRIEPDPVLAVHSDDAGTAHANLLRDRVRAADCAARVQLVTWTDLQSGGATRHRMVARVLEPLAGHCAPELTLDAPSGEAGVPVGTSLLAFVRDPSPGAEGSARYHLMPAGAAQLKTVRDAALVASFVR